MRDPIVDHIGRPRADRLRRQRDDGGLCHRRAGNGENRDRQEQSHSQRGHHLHHEVGRFHRAGKREFRGPVGVEDAPIGSDASFIGLPRLIEGFDDRIVDAQRIGPGDEVAHHLGLGDWARHRILAIQSGARPAKLGNDDALAGILASKLLVHAERFIDGARSGCSLPIGQHMDGDIVDGRNELRMLEPDIWHVGGGDRHRDLALHSLDLANEVAHYVVRIAIVQRLRAEHRLIADDDAVDVAVMFRQRDGSVDFLLVLLFPVVDPHAERDAQTVFGRELRHKIETVGDAVSPDRARIRGYGREIGSDLLLGGIVALGAAVGIDRGKRHRRERPICIRRRHPLMHGKPHQGMGCGRNRDHNGDDDVAHFPEISIREPALSPSAASRREACSPSLNFF